MLANLCATNNNNNSIFFHQFDFLHENLNIYILKVTQTKHHWWWKANEVFDISEATKEFNGSFVFLEEDHLLAPDALHLLNLMERKKIEEKVTS